jgi:hypothetical protein
MTGWVNSGRRTPDRRMTALGQTAKNSPQALTSELPPITDMARREEAPFALPVPPSRPELPLVRSFSAF